MDSHNEIISSPDVVQSVVSEPFKCGAPIKNRIQSALGGVFSSSIRDFKFRSVVNRVPIGEFDYVPSTRGYAPRNASAKIVDVATQYNGVVQLPVTGSEGIFAINVYYGGVKVQFAVYDGENASETAFMAANLSSPFAISAFITKINNGFFRAATSSRPADANVFFSELSYYSMLYNFFGRVGVTGDSHVLVSVTNVAFTNAFWTGASPGIMVFGNASDSPDIDPLCSTDVGAHELTHALQTFTTEFEYQGETGALNESIADVFGTMAEFYVNSNIDTPDWTMGEAFRFIIRDMQNPKRCKQPTVHSGEFWADPEGQADNGGVHTNSGVTNYMCYLAVEGGEKHTDSENYEQISAVRPVRGFTLRSYTDALYAVLTKKVLDPNSTSLRDFANAMIEEFRTKGDPVAVHHVQECAAAVNLADPPPPLDEMPMPPPAPEQPPYDPPFPAPPSPAPPPVRAGYYPLKTYSGPLVGKFPSLCRTKAFKVPKNADIAVDIAAGAVDSGIGVVGLWTLQTGETLATVMNREPNQTIQLATNLTLFSAKAGDVCAVSFGPAGSASLALVSVSGRPTPR